MSGWISDNLDLSSVKTQGGGRIMPGKHVAKISDISTRATKSGNGTLVEVDLEVGGAVMKDFINVRNPNPKAQEIGQERLKALLTHCGHPNPDKPSAANPVGMKVGINVVPSTFTNDKGEEREGSGLQNFGAYFAPDELDGQTSVPTPSQDTSQADDDIPF